MADTEVAVQAALSKIGTMYVWGATGPDNFDCSGLVQWAFKQAGIDTSRTTYTQILEGEAVQGSPQRGDLVFPDAGHVMIALGGDTAVHAPQAGEPVQISNYWTEPIAIRRLGGNSGSVGETHTTFQNANIVDDAKDGLSSLVAPMNAAGDVFKFLTTQGGWKRILLVIVGGLLICIAVVMLIISINRSIVPNPALDSLLPKKVKPQGTGFNTGNLPGSPTVSKSAQIVKKVAK